MPPHTDSPCRCCTVAELLDELGLSLREDGTFLWSGFPDPVVTPYCQRCGGRLPNLWNARITDEEVDRLLKIIDSISTVEDAIEKLGPPDYDARMHYYDSRDGGMPLVVSEYDVIQDPKWVFNEAASGTRNIEYYHVSEAANLEFYFAVGPESETSKPGVQIMLKLTEDDRRRLFPESDGTGPGENSLPKAS